MRRLIITHATYHFKQYPLGPNWKADYIRSVFREVLFWAHGKLIRNTLINRHVIIALNIIVL